jgi:hypothetical protein
MLTKIVACLDEIPYTIIDNNFKKKLFTNLRSTQNNPSILVEAIMFTTTFPIKEHPGMRCYKIKS